MKQRIVREGRPVCDLLSLAVGVVGVLIRGALCLQTIANVLKGLEDMQVRSKEGRCRFIDFSLHITDVGYYCDGSTHEVRLVWNCR
jgi:hypothetical protein